MFANISLPLGNHRTCQEKKTQIKMTSTSKKKESIETTDSMSISSLDIRYSQNSKGQEYSCAIRLRN